MSTNTETYGLSTSVLHGKDLIVENFLLRRYDLYCMRRRTDERLSLLLLSSFIDLQDFKRGFRLRSHRFTFKIRGIQDCQL